MLKLLRDGNRPLPSATVILFLIAVACGDASGVSTSAVVAPGATLASVTSVHDGDTFTAKYPNGAPFKVRLANIDAPELAQPHGPSARSALSSLVLGKSVELRVSTLDRYGRTIAVVLVGGVDVSAVMVTTGLAWVYTQYNTDDSLPALETEAREARRGLWSDDNPIPPWEWRHPGVLFWEFY